MTLRKYGIIGFPLEHSFSPLIHNRAFAEYNIPGHYEKIEIPPEQFELKINALKKEDWAGFNVTIPFKTAILPYLDEIDQRALQIGAVNTIRVSDNGKWIGYNTDYKGFLKPLNEYKDSTKTCLVLGAGGAARAVCVALATEIKAQQLTIANRTEEKAQKLAQQIAPFTSAKIHSCTLNNILVNRFDCIVNTTSVGMGAQVNQNILNVRAFAHSKTIVYDLIYNPAETLFLKIARLANLQTINGLPMLVYQAEEAFKIWTGRGFTQKLLEFFAK